MLKWAAERAFAAPSSWWGTTCRLLVQVHNTALLRRLTLTMPCNLPVDHAKEWLQPELDLLATATVLGSTFNSLQNVAARHKKKGEPLYALVSFFRLRIRSCREPRHAAPGSDSQALGPRCNAISTQKVKRGSSSLLPSRSPIVCCQEGRI